MPASFALALTIAHALEDVAGNPPHTHRLSTRGAFLVEFTNALVQEQAITLSPLRFSSCTVVLERHEEADNRFHVDDSLYADVVALDFPLEH